MDIVEHDGFFKGRSTTSNLAIFQELLVEHVKGGSKADVVYIDLSKAFDSLLFFDNYLFPL